MEIFFLDLHKTSTLGSGHLLAKQSETKNLSAFYYCIKRNLLAAMFFYDKVNKQKAHRYYIQYLPF